MTLNELTTKVQLQSFEYLKETGDVSEMSEFPKSIVDFVIEYAINESHFPSYFSDEQIATRLSRCIASMSMACIEVYSRAGAEGEKAHSENAISRTYDGAWISTRLHDVLPNFVGVL